jgi:hypothetical protein
MTDPTLPETTTMRRLKRSRVLQVSSLMATVSFSMAACGSPQKTLMASAAASSTKSRRPPLPCTSRKPA